ncbi:NUDIX hydrolase [Sporolactobacillus sp. Y61]|uniref:NUDIX hydrolase n=1 Tax=Sporolactobacillus sp. Y61 TaxID=3160863 RepID=A0AAU8IDT5_9BACL
MGYIEEIRSMVGHRPLILVGAVAVISNSKGHILLQKRRYPENTWGLPGGLMEPGESSEETAMREVREETGLTIDRLKLAGVFSGANMYAIAENGDQFYPVTIAYQTSDYKGELIMDPAESVSFAFMNPDDLPEKMLKNHRKILNEILTED